MEEGVLGGSVEGLPISPKNSMGSDLELLLLDPRINLVPLTMDRGNLSSSPVKISPSSKSNVTIRRGKGRPRIKKRSISSKSQEGNMAEGNFRDIPITQALDRVLRALDSSWGVMMNLISFNIRGLGGKAKFLSLSDFFLKNFPVFIFIQETMHKADRAISYFRPMFPGWHMAVQDAEGLFGGELFMWDPNIPSFKAYDFFGGIILSSHLRGFNKRLHFVNLYAPYLNMASFWKRMICSGIFQLENLVIAGDFNLTLQNS